MKQITFLFLMISAIPFLSSCNKEDYRGDSTHTFNTRDKLLFDNYRKNTQNVHPKVLYFKNGLFRHRFWMSYTPYPDGNPKYENPCIAFSDDGLKWRNIPNNPLDDSSSETKYNSDTHLVYNPRTEFLECWYRYADSKEVTETIYRQISADGINWTPKQQVHQTNGLATVLAPCIIYDKQRDLYKIWVVANDKDGRKVVYYESKNGTNWQYKHNINLAYNYNGINYFPWHADVIEDNGKFLMIMMVKENNNGDSWILFHSQSVDNINWTTPLPMLLPRLDGWDQQLYRSSLVKVDYKYRLYYSARSFKFKYGIGILEADNIYDFINMR